MECGFNSCTIGRATIGFLDVANHSTRMCRKDVVSKGNLADDHVDQSIHEYTKKVPHKCMWTYIVWCLEAHYLTKASNSSVEDAKLTALPHRPAMR